MNLNLTLSTPIFQYKKLKELEDQSKVDILRLQTICLFGEICIEERRYDKIRNALKGEIETSKKFPMFYAKVMFMFAVSSIKITLKPLF